MTTLPRKTRPRGFAPWTPRPDTLALLSQVQGVMAEYADYLPLTIRQVFYRLVGAHGYDKTEHAYARLCETMNRARRAGRIPFHAIRDDGGTRHGAGGWGDAAQWLHTHASAARNFTLDRQEGQKARLWLLCEAAGMVPMLASAARPYGVPVLSSGGFDSLTAKHDLSRELSEVLRDGLGAEVLHIGDCDPSGDHVFASLKGDVSAMVRSMVGDDDLRFTRLAVTREQIAALGLPTAPPKPTDRRAFEGETAQAEAIPPDVLSRIVSEAIEARQDGEARASLLLREAMERAALLDRLGVRDD